MARTIQHCDEYGKPSSFNNINLFISPIDHFRKKKKKNLPSDNIQKGTGYICYDI